MRKRRPFTAVLVCMHTEAEVVMAVSYFSTLQKEKGQHGVGRKRTYSVMSDEEDTDSCSDRELEIFLPPQFPYEVTGNNKEGSRLGYMNPYLVAYLQLFKDEVIKDFLWMDSCAILADKYLLAMVYVYFRRSGLPTDSYNRWNFFVALYLANDIEEDDEDEKYEIFPWALGKGWMTQFPAFLSSRDHLWHNMGFRAVVSKRTCEEVIAMAPHHDIWKRKRLPHHGGAIRAYLRSDAPTYGRTCPKYCNYCSQARMKEEEEQQQQDSSLRLLPPVVPTVTKLDLIDDIDLSFGGYGFTRVQQERNNAEMGRRQAIQCGGFYQE